MLGHGQGPTQGAEGQMTEEDRCFISGFLEKESKGNNWNKRYFVLDNSSLKYYKKKPDVNDPDSLQCRGEIRLKKIVSVAESTVWTGKNFCFVLTLSSGPVYLIASTNENMHDWIDHLISHPLATLSLGKQVQSGENGEQQSVYQTKVVGGVVMRKKMQNSSQGTSLATSFESPDPQLSVTSGQGLMSEGEATGMAMRSTSACSINTLSAQAGTTAPGASHRRDGGRVAKSGYCIKQGGIRKNWKRRFFLLDPFGLAYYGDATDKDPLKNIPLSYLVSVVQSTKGGLEDRDHVFEVATVGRVFYMQAENDEECQAWIEAIKSVLPDQPATIATPTGADSKKAKPLVKNAQQLWRYSVGKYKAYLQDSTDSEDEEET